MGLRRGSTSAPNAISAWSTADLAERVLFALTQAMSVANERIRVTNRQLGSERLIPLIAGVKEGLPARGPQKRLSWLKC